MRKSVIDMGRERYTPVEPSLKAHMKETLLGFGMMARPRLLPAVAKLIPNNQKPVDICTRDEAMSNFEDLSFIMYHPSTGYTSEVMIVKENQWPDPVTVADDSRFYFHGHLPNWGSVGLILWPSYQRNCANPSSGWMFHSPLSLWTIEAILKQWCDDCCVTASGIQYSVSQGLPNFFLRKHPRAMGAYSLKREDRHHVPGPEACSDLRVDAEFDQTEFRMERFRGRINSHYFLEPHWTIIHNEYGFISMVGDIHYHDDVSVDSYFHSVPINIRLTMVRPANSVIIRDHSVTTHGYPTWIIQVLIPNYFEVACEVPYSMTIRRNIGYAMSLAERLMNRIPPIENPGISRSFPPIFDMS
jgi:hypothetical protein